MSCNLPNYLNSKSNAAFQIHIPFLMFKYWFTVPTGWRLMRKIAKPTTAKRPDSNFSFTH